MSKEAYTEVIKKLQEASRLLEAGEYQIKNRLYNIQVSLSNRID